jgi:hypothetical protein
MTLRQYLQGESNQPKAFENGYQAIYRPGFSLPMSLPPTAIVKWGCVTQILPKRVEHWQDLQKMLMPLGRDPAANDVIVGRVVELGRNESVELSCGRKAELHLGDVLVGAFGNRYATNQFEGVIPRRMDYYHMLSQGAVIGQVVSASQFIGNPTVIEPLGFLNDGTGNVLNLTQHSLRGIASSRVPALLVLGSSMDAGKTTAAAALVRGLCLAGWSVHAGKLTGTGCAKDINKMRDAGAQRVLDFTSCGYASTAGATAEELKSISSRLIGHLSQGAPDILVLEIADGVVQSETDMLARMLATERMVDGAIIAIHDVMSVLLATTIVEQQFGLKLFGVSGAATISPLSTTELRQLTEHRVFDIPTLSNPAVALAMDSFLATSPILHENSILSAI